MKFSKSFAAVAAMVALSGAAQGALVDRGGGMIYDTVRGVTWLADMNYAATSGHTGVGVMSDGRMTWNAATAWVSSLVYGGFDDWRLPTLDPSDTTCSASFDPAGGFPTQYFGFGCTGGELSGLFVSDLGNKPNESVLNQEGDTAEQIANLALFRNVQDYVYWSGTDFAPTPNVSWLFVSGIGFQGSGSKVEAFYAVAVRAGDVIAPVPEPQTLALALLALGGTVVVRARRTA